MVGLKDFYSMIGSISEILLHDWWHLRAFLALISLTGPSRCRLGSLQASVLMTVLRKEGTSNLWSTICFRVLSLVICMGPILQMRTLDPEKESDLLTATQLKGREHYPLSHTLQILRLVSVQASVLQECKNFYVDCNP